MTYIINSTIKNENKNMQRTNSQTSTVVSESPSKKGKKKNAAAEEKVVVKPNNVSSLIKPSPFIIVTIYTLLHALHTRI